MNPIHVTIDNFQSIDHLDLEVNGFTAITGKTNIGKSAIVRAISSCLLNNSVIGMVRSGASHASIRIKSSEYDILWEKAEKGLNRYTVNGQLYDKVGGNTLSAISDLGFQSIKVGPEEINPWLASQFFPIFLLDKTGPQVTEFISEVSRLNVIQDSIVLSARKKKKYADVATSKENDAKGIKSKLSGLEKYTDFKGLLADILAQKNSIEEYERNVSYCSKTINKIEEILEKQAVLSAIEAVSIPSCSLDTTRYAQARSLDNGLKLQAKSIISLKALKQITVPALLQEFDRYFTAKGLSGVISLSREVDLISKAVGVSIPSLISEVEVYRSALKRLASIERAKSQLFGDVELPQSDVISEEMSNLAVASRVHHQLLTITEEQESLKESFKSIADQLQEIESEISKIPTCPTCRKPR